MPKVLFITNGIPHYRLPLYQQVGKRVDLTIAHISDLTNSNDYNEIKLKLKNTGPFSYYQGNLNIDRYDVVILPSTLRFLNLYKVLFKPNRNYKVILFGIGVSASYNKKYDKNKFMGFLLKYLHKKADGAIFYDNYPVIKYSSMGIRPEKLFVAYNTVVSSTSTILPKSERNSIIFIGTLYKQKGIFNLLEAYKLGLHQGKKLPILNIIGGGEDKIFVEQWIVKHGFTEKIKILGKITEEDKLKPFFRTAYCCISPTQAGLSVQKAFSYGVPFITSYYPISGGEFTSIINGVTGFFYDGSSEDLLKKIIYVVNNPEIDQIFSNCKEFYERFRSPQNWVDGFCDAIDYVIKEQSINNI